MSNEEFVKAWQASDTHRQVAERLKVSDAFVRRRSAYLRSMGVKLKRYQWGAGLEKLDIGALNKLCKEQ